MKPLRVLVADLPPIMRDIMARSDMEVAGSVVRRQDVCEELRRSPADVVILGLEASEAPEVCSRILDEFPETTVVGLAADGKRTSLYVDDIGLDQLLAAIRQASRSGGGEANRRRRPPSLERPC